MKHEMDEYKMTPWANVLKYMGFLMALLYVATGVAVAWKSEELFNIPGKYALPIGGVLIGYGIFRFYRLYQKYF